jgi:RES domain-containing protein
VTAPECLDAANCPVPGPNEIDLRRLHLARIRQGTTLHTAYVRGRRPALFNASGSGNARFSPLASDGSVVPTMYCAATQTVALLETTFHGVHDSGSRLISEVQQLAPRGLVALTAPASLPLIDLTDQGLARVGLTRGQLVATTPQHYACTREWAVALHGRRVGPVTPVGLLWRSRIAELAGSDSLLLEDLLVVAGGACVLFGDRLPTTVTAWRAGDPRYDDLTSGDGRLLAEQIAEQLGAVIVPN